MIARIDKQLATPAPSSAELAEAMKKRGRMLIDTAKLEQHAVKVLDAQLASAVEPSIGQVEQTLAGFERQVAELGAQRTGATAQEVDRVVAALEGKVVCTAVGRICLALLPLAATLLVLRGLTITIAHALGLGPLLGWVWSSFAAAQVW